jgi:hypothetical protein
MNDPTIDRATFDELKDAAGSEFVAELVDTFLVEAPRLIDELRSAYDKRDADVFRRSRTRSSRTATHSARARSPPWRRISSSAASACRRQPAARRWMRLAAEYGRVAAALSELRNA